MFSPFFNTDNSSAKSSRTVMNISAILFKGNELYASGHAWLSLRMVSSSMHNNAKNCDNCTWVLTDNWTSDIASVNGDFKSMG